MGFNAARTKWSVDRLDTPLKDVTTPECDVATTDEIRATMLPPTTADNPQPQAAQPYHRNPPQVGTRRGCAAQTYLPPLHRTDMSTLFTTYVAG